MCGIAGVFAPEHQDRIRSIVGEMVGSLHHRGPNDRGFWHAGQFAMGMTRLSIVDVAGGHQPISSEDGMVTVVCNGEIYNHDELRRGLQERGHVFSTKSDVEVIAHLYEERGPDCVRDLRGMFAFAVWDERNQRLVLGRDRLGIKPLYYSASGSRLLFGSELKAVMRSGLVGGTVDESAVDRFLTFGYIPAPLTIYREVRKLEPAHLLIWERGQVRLERYWDLVFKPDDHADDEELIERFMALFRDAVRSHLMGEVPLGAFLSGGIDSGFIVAMMSEAMSSPVRTFTMAFGGSAGTGFDERSSARLVSERYGTSHTEFEIAPSVEDVLETAVDAFDEPFADDSIIPSYHICRLAKREVTVALTGLGGDELFAGYERHLGLQISRTYERVPRALRSAIAPLAEALPEPAGGINNINRLKRFVRAAGESPASRYLGYVTVLNGSMKDAIYQDVTLSSSRAMDGVARFGGGPHASLLGQALYNDIHTYLPDDILALTDRLSMLQGLELRVPFLDHPLVEFAATLPDRAKIRRLTKKYLLRQAAQPFLPAALFTKPKQGFGSPLGSWLRHELSGYLRESLSATKLARHGFFRADAVHRLIDEHASRGQSHERPLFAMLMFQKWWDRYQ